MIVSTRRTRILMCKNPTDMRLGYDGLHKLAKKAFGQNPLSGQYFVFVNRRRTSCKIYTWDGTGEVLICKRLDRGTFCRANPHYKGQIKMTPSEFSQFFEGLNISGRILESVPVSRPRKKLLRFIAPYRRVNANATDRIYTTKSQTPSGTQ